MALLKGPVLNSKKLELKLPKVSFFGAGYSADDKHPGPKKIHRYHLKPQSYDIPVLNGNFHSRTSTPSQSEIKNTSLSGLQHPSKEKYFHNNKYNNKCSLSGPQHPPKVKYSESVPKLAIRNIRDTAYNSYIAETLFPLKSAIKSKKQIRFAEDPVTSQDHYCKENQTTPSQMDHQCGRS